MTTTVPLTIGDLLTITGIIIVVVGFLIYIIIRGTPRTSFYG